MFDHSKFSKISTLIFDVDGVFTNCRVLVMDDGSLLRTMNVRDGQALKLAKEAGYRLAAITKGASSGTRIRLEALGIEDYFDKLIEKYPTFSKYQKENALSKDEILYMGDDLPDLDVFPHVGIAACPSDACPEVMATADFISSKGGGEGCVREVIEKVMRIQGKWKF